jgi:anti-sigma B factor antagonist
MVAISITDLLDKPFKRRRSIYSRWVNPGECNAMDVAISNVTQLGTKITLKGKLDIAGAEIVDSPLTRATETGGNVVVDMEDVEFITSVGIRQLVKAAKAAARGSGKLVLLRPNSLVSEGLITSGLEDILPIARTEVEALAVLNGAA